TRIALASATAAKLAVHPAGFVAFRADDVEAADIRDAWSELNVSATTGHVGGDGHGARLARAGHDLGFLHVILRVQHRVWDLLALEHAGEHFALLHAHRTDEHRLFTGVGGDDLLHHGTELLAACLV